MKLLLPVIFGSFFAINTAKAQLVQVISTGFDGSGQQSGWTLFRKGVNSQFQEWDYESQQAFSAPTCLTHYYQVGGSNVMDDWFVSPAFTIPAGGQLDSLRYYFSGFGLPQTADTVCVYLLNGNPDPDLAASLEILMDFRGTAYQNDNTWRLLSPITLPAQTGNSYIAFRHRTVNNWLDVRFDNLAVSKISTAGIEAASATNAVFSPNPSNGKPLQISYDVAVYGEPILEIFSTTGQLVSSQKVSNLQLIDLNIAPGCYTCVLKSSLIPFTFQSRLIVQ
jgi:hypothetical protein